MPPIPAHYAKRIRQQFPKQAEELLVALDLPASTSIRWNTSKLLASPFPGEPVPWHRHASTLAVRPRFTLDPRFHAGAYYVQEASSMAVSVALESYRASAFNDPKTEGLRILDMCAAPGGKSTLIASWMRSGDLLLANEVVPARRVILKENLLKWGAPNCYVSGWQAHEIPGEAQWDVVLVDAPCSGEGLFRKEPIARSQWSAELIASCGILQAQLLSEAYRLLAPGGLLVFSTCTTSEEENCANARILSQYAGLEEMPLASLPQFGWLRLDFGYQALPHLGPGEGFYLCCFRKTGFRSPETFSHEGSTTLAQQAFEQAQEALNIQDSEGAVPAFNGKDLCLQHGGHSGFWRKLMSNFSLSQTKSAPELLTCVAELKGRDWIPTAASALAIYLDFGAPVREVDLITAQQLLKGLQPPGGLSQERGWVLLRFDGVNLMWSKQLGNRYNTLWPNPWRIKQNLPYHSNS